MAPKVRRDHLLMLDLLVQEFLTEMKDYVLTPKCHYLIHYAGLIEMYGPLRSL